MFPITATKLEDITPEVQGRLLAIVNKAQPQANPFLLHTLGIPDTGKSTLVASLIQSLKLRKPIVVDFKDLPDEMVGYRLLQMLLEKRANIIFDHSGTNAQHVLLLRYATAIGYKVSLCPISNKLEADSQIQIDELLPTYKALGATLYELSDDSEDEDSFESLGAQIAKAI